MGVRCVVVSGWLPGAVRQARVTRQAAKRSRRRVGGARSVRAVRGKLGAAVGLGDLVALGQLGKRGGDRRPLQARGSRDLAGGQRPLGRQRR
jgi:hypothetical protein